LRILMANLGAHLSDDTLSQLVSGELGSAKLRRTKRHLSKCWKCRSRHEELDRAAMAFVELHKHVITPNPPEEAQWRELLLARLGEASAQLPSSFWSRFPLRFRLANVPKMNPLLASTAVVVVACAFLLLIWQRSAPSVSASELLERAKTHDANSSRIGTPGVIYQKVRITTKQGAIERDLYRDREGQRQPKSQPVASDLIPLETKLSIAGVNWDEPLSAASYENWHDRQELKQDEVKRSGKGLLTLRTQTSNRMVVGESLTVRDDDFHPIKRTVELLDAGTIEITEINYAVLNWHAVNENLFEPLTPSPNPTRSVPALVAPLPPPLPTPVQLLDAELQARLTLNRLGADSGAQIRVTHTDTGIEVKGVVDSEQRKQEIVSRLRIIPYVTPSILSIEELSNHPSPSFDVMSVQQYSLVGQPSPLEQYMQEKDLPREELNQTSQRLLDACLTMQRESDALAELEDRFGSLEEQLGASSRPLLTDLETAHLKTLAEGLDVASEKLQQLGFVPSSSSIPSDIAQESSLRDLERNARETELVCQELITGSDHPRAASDIASAFFASLSRLRSVVAKLRLQLQVH
jgi:hypothetical protein